MYERIKLSTLYKYSQLATGKDDWKPVKNIARPILNLQYRAEGFDVKDIKLYLDDSKTWPHLVQEDLRKGCPGAWVGNAGLDGHSSHGHVLLMDKVITKIHPDILIFLVGLNDLALSVEFRDASTHVGTENDAPNIRDADWRSVGGSSKRDVREVIDFLHVSAAPDDVLHPGHLHHAPTDIAIGFPDPVGDKVER